MVNPAMQDIASRGDHTLSAQELVAVDIALVSLATTTAVHDDKLEPASSLEPAVLEEPLQPELRSTIKRSGIAALLAQHFSSSWNARSCEFAFYLFLIELFPDTLLPASIYGFVTTGVAILGAGWTGGLVDRIPRLKMVRIFTFVQKISIMICSSAFLGLFIRFGSQDYRHAPASAWIAFSIIVLFGSTLGLANIGTSVAVERDWVTTISFQHSEDTLTRLNTYMRRIDLLCKLLAPLFTSLLTTAVSYPFAVAFLMGFAAMTLLFELWWIQVVFNKFPILSASDKVKNGTTAAPLVEAETLNVITEDPAANIPRADAMSKRNIPSRSLSLYNDWREFAQMPVFASSVSISLLYLTVLSFDGTMLSYLKTRQYSDAFIAGQRGICVVTGLAGTVLMPWMEKRLGLVRAGAWSIVSEALTLIPVLASFYVSMPASASGPAWSAALLFGGMAASRIGLWAFDLCQLKELQLSLNTHPKRNRFMGLQFSLQNIADLVKYIITIVLSQPRHFRWAALISFISVCLGACSYAVFVKKERGHIWHLDRVPLLRKYV